MLGFSVLGNSICLATKNPANELSIEDGITPAACSPTTTPATTALVPATAPIVATNPISVDSDLSDRRPGGGGT